MIRIQNILSKCPQGHQLITPYTSPSFRRYCTNQPEKNNVTDIAKTSLFSSESKTLQPYSNIFTQEGRTVSLHLPRLGGSAAEKRLEFVRMYLQANHLIGNKSVPLKNLIATTNEKGFKTSNKKKNTTHAFKQSLLRPGINKQFEFFKNEEEEVNIALTDIGKKIALDRAGLLNEIIPEVPVGRAKDLLIIFKDQGWLDKSVKLKTIVKACSAISLDLTQYRVKELLQREYNIFILDSDTVKLSVIGKKIITSLEEDSTTIKPLKRG